eukprot:1339479-Amorphochlora_amoeboformis.AAC.2
MLSSLKKTAKKYTRRVLQGVHQSKDGNQQSEKEFAQMVARFDDIEKNLRQFYDHIQAYVSALRGFGSDLGGHLPFEYLGLTCPIHCESYSCTLQANISGDLLYFFDAKSNNRVHADKYHTICTKMHVTRWTEEMVKKRKRKLTDVQSYRRQVTGDTIVLWASNPTDPSGVVPSQDCEDEEPRKI